MHIEVFETAKYLPERNQEHENLFVYEVGKKRWTMISLENLINFPQCYSHWAREPAAPVMPKPILDWRELEPGVHYWMIDRADPDEKDIIMLTQKGLTKATPNNYRCIRLYDPAEYRFRENTHVFFPVDGEPNLPPEFEYFAEPVVPNAPPIYLGIMTEFYRRNKDCRFPERVEGYWRSANTFYPPIDPTQRALPWPVPVKEFAFNRIGFLADLEKAEIAAERELYRGFSRCRLTGISLGNAEFVYKNWRWPAGYKHYIKMGVLPSAAFYKFITGEDHPTLPSYGRKDYE